MEDNRRYRNEPLDNAKLYSFNIEQELLDWLRQEAEARKVSVSQLMREAITFYMKFQKAQA